MQKGHRLTYSLTCGSGVDTSFTITVPDSMNDTHDIKNYICDVGIACHKNLCPEESTCGAFCYRIKGIKSFGYSKQELEAADLKGKFSSFI